MLEGMEAERLDSVDEGQGRGVLKYSDTIFWLCLQCSEVEVVVNVEVMDVF